MLTQLLTTTTTHKFPSQVELPVDDGQIMIAVLEHILEELLLLQGGFALRRDHVPTARVRVKLEDSVSHGELDQHLVV